MAVNLTPRQRELGEFYAWLQLRADFLRQQRAEAEKKISAETGKRIKSTSISDCSTQYKTRQMEEDEK